ncbi:MAG: type II secretion system protein GspE, partial [Armatimonadota bacterium]
VATLPTVHGEKVVLRILDKSAALLRLEDLGFLDQNLARFSTSYRKPYGMILVTGPTGSGKSTTLYATLNILNDVGKNIITVEDPVEYRLPGINQCQVNVKAGMTFAAALRSILRADPDIVLVGEIRDRETATIAIEAALTGHLVLSTLHTNDASTTPTRLVEMGVEPFLIASSIIAVCAQRLVRTICPKCKEEYVATREALLRYGFPVPEEVGAETGGSVHIYRATSCEACRKTGYKGRTGVHELLRVTDSIRDEILRKSASHSIRQIATSEGMRTLQEDAVQKVLVGQTTVDEVLRVIYSG